MVDDKPLAGGETVGTGPSASAEAPLSSILDTNILVSATASQRQLHLAAQNVVRWPTLGRQTYVSGQILREYLVVATRPLESNGLELACEEAVANVSVFRSLLDCLEENDQVQKKLAELVRTHECRGVLIHDANIVATALTHHIPAIVTENPRDFRQFADLVEVVPLVSIAH